jgi:hypothetical protein
MGGCPNESPSSDSVPLGFDLQGSEFLDLERDHGFGIGWWWAFLLGSGGASFGVEIRELGERYRYFGSGSTERNDGEG